MIANRKGYLLRMNENLYDKIKRKASHLGISMNDLINLLLIKSMKGAV